MLILMKTHRTERQVGLSPLFSFWFSVKVDTIMCWDTVLQAI